MSLFSWIFWGVWGSVGLVYELYAVHYEKRSGALPLTRVVRDRLMRRFVVVKLGVLLFLSWLILHFTLSVPW